MPTANQDPCASGNAHDPENGPDACRARISSYHSGLFLQRKKELFSLQPCLLNDRDQRTLRQLRVIGHCHNQISLLVPEMNVAAGLAIDLEAEMLQSLDGLLSRDYRKLGQIARPLCREMRSFFLWVPVPGGPDNALQGLSLDWRLPLLQ